MVSAVASWSMGCPQMAMRWASVQSAYTILVAQMAKLSRTCNLQVTDGHLAAALRNGQPGPAQATQNPAQQAAAPGRTALQTENGHGAQTPILRELATSCGSVRDGKMTPMGFEPMSRP